MKINQADIDLIRALGGPSKVAELLKFEKHGGTQRVQNWLVRGIPSTIKIQYPALFMPELATPPTSQAQEGVAHG